MLKEIKDLKQWVCYSVVSRNGKKTKPPRNAITGRNAKTNDPQTWATYQEAKEAVKKYKFDGVGFMLYGGYCGIDIDHCIDENGNIKAYAKEIIDTLDSYTEYSPSGTGIHIICKGKLENARKSELLEMYQIADDYTGGRYFTVTEKPYQELKPIQERTEQIKEVYKKYFPAEPQEKRLNNSVDPARKQIDDVEIIQKILKSEKGKNLLQGNFKPFFGSQSEADLSLCNLIAMHTKDKKQIDRIFRGSGLYRDKWEVMHDKKNNRTYGEMTIDKALSGNNKEPENEEKPLITKSALNCLPDFFKQIQTKKPILSTGFKKLDKILDGGFYAGSYIIGAGTSIGKTTFLQQIADNLAKQGHDILYFSLEMGIDELISKSLSREMFLIDELNANTTREILKNEYTEKQKEVLNQAITNYKQYADNVYIFEGVGNIGTTQIIKTVKSHILQTGRKPIVFIDYLQILARNEHGEKREKTDKDILDLKRLSRDMQIPVISITSVGRHNYNNEASLEAGKESGGIEYGADVVIMLEVDGVKDDIKNATKVNKKIIKSYKGKEIKSINAVLLKNRHGIAYGKINYKYHAKYNTFQECNFIQTESEIENNLEKEQKKRVII